MIDLFNLAIILKSNFFGAIMFQNISDLYFRQSTITFYKTRGGEKLENTIIKYITGPNGKGLKLNRADVETLLFLFEHKLISQPQLFQFYSLIKAIHYDSFRKKVNKFAKLGLIQLKKYVIKKKRKGVETTLIQLTEKGFWLLKKAGYLNNTSFDINQIGMKWDRTLAIKEIVLHAIKAEGMKKGVVTGGQNKHLYLFDKKKATALNLVTNAEYDLPPNTVTICSNEFSEDMTKISSEKIVDSFVLKRDILYSFNSITQMFPNDSHENMLEPDWILGLNNNLLDIEVDTGYRTFVNGEEIIELGKAVTIEERMNQYIQLHENYPLNHTVIYVYLDDSFLFKKNYGKKLQRIRNLKKIIMNVDSIRESPLDIYVISLESSKNVVETLFHLFRGDISDEGLIEDAFKEISSKSEINAHYTNQLLSIENARQLNYLIPQEELRIQKLFYFYALKNGKRIEKVLIPIPMYEGNVRSQALLQHLSNLLKENKLKWGLPDDSKILAIYPNKEAMDRDIFRSDAVKEQIILCNLEELKFDKYCKFYDINRKGEMSFNEATRNNEI